MLFHRSFGKFTYKDESQYFIGTVGYEDVDCDYIDHTYVRAQSPLLDQVIIVVLFTWTSGLDSLLEGIFDTFQNLRQEIAAFSQELRTLSAGAATLGLGTGGDGGIRSSGSGQVSLEFYHKRRKWLFPSEIIPWEVGDTNLH